ncbi:Small nuclear ribonucleoprotein LSM2, partial [Aspergillus sclerotialis]
MHEQIPPSRLKPFHSFAKLTPKNSFFKTLTNQPVTLELKNDIRIRGTLKSVDQYLNIKLDDVDVLDLDKYPHLSSVKNMFIRGSVVRYVVLPRSEVDVGLLEDATRRGEFGYWLWLWLWLLTLVLVLEREMRKLR